MRGEQEYREHQFGADPADGDLPGVGVRLHYLDWGHAPAPTILFLHGGGLTAHTWDVVCDLLRADYRCLALDLRGHGDSEWSPDGEYEIEDHAADVAAAADWFGLDQFVLVGQSLGGVAALSYAGRHSERLKGLVLVDSGPPTGRAAGVARVHGFMDRHEEHATFEEFVERAARFNPLRPHDRLRRSLLQNLRRTPQGTWAWKYDRRIQRPFHPDDPAARSRAEERSRMLRQAARDVRCPTLVVRGGLSDVFLDEDAERTVVDLRHGRWVRIDGAGHTVQGDRPQELAAELRDFLAGDLGAPAGGAPPRTGGDASA